MKIGILGSGPVGQALARGYEEHGHDVRIGTRKDDVEGLPIGSPAHVAADAEVVVLAVRGMVAVDVVTSLRHQLADKVLVDATNPLDYSSAGPRLFVGGDDSLGERVQRAVTRTKVVKAYNIVGNALMVDPRVPGGPPTMFIGGDDDGGKRVVTGLLRNTGWDVVDLGGIATSRYLEAMAMVWVLYGQHSGTWRHAFKLLRS
jgi:predicted dinucleotide-binding enzyme